MTPSWIACEPSWHASSTLCAAPGASCVACAFASKARSQPGPTSRPALRRGFRIQPYLRSRQRVALRRSRSNTVKYVLHEMRVLSAVALALLCSSCATLVNDTADQARCFELEDETVSEVYEWIVDTGEIPATNVANFLLSDAYLTNPDAWDWAFCMTRFGWDCEEPLGAGTLFPTPPTECRSSGRDISTIASNPFLG